MLGEKAAVEVRELHTGQDEDGRIFDHFTDRRVAGGTGVNSRKRRRALVHQALPPYRGGVEEGAGGEQIPYLSDRPEPVDQQPGQDPDVADIGRRLDQLPGGGHVPSQ